MSVFEAIDDRAAAGGDRSHAERLGGGQGLGGLRIRQERDMPNGHDALTWVRPGGPEARDLPWLDGDLLILDALNGAELSTGVHQVA